jgi:hypothetical protein
LGILGILAFVRASSRNISITSCKSARARFQESSK